MIGLADLERDARADASAARQVEQASTQHQGRQGDGAAG